MKPITPGERFRLVDDALHERHFGMGWFNPNDLVDSMRSALIVRLARQLGTDAASGIAYVDVTASRDYMAAVLARTPYVTADRQLIDMTAAAAQMVSRDWDERQRLCAMFVTNTMDSSSA